MDPAFPEDEAYALDRRAMMRQLGLLVAALGGGALAACAREPAAPDAAALDAAPAPMSVPVDVPRAFLPPQRETFEAATARVLPSDEDPGAREANVVEYIDRELARPGNEKIKRAMLAGIVALDNYARRLGGRRFVELGAEEQDDILHQIQKASDRGQDFVKFLVLLTLEGFAGDPMYGGNLNGAGWKFIGYGPGNPDGSGRGAHGRHGHHH